MIDLRASFAPIAAKCAAATVPPAVRIESPEDDAARVGRAVHGFLTERIAGHNFEPEDAASLHQADVDQVRPLCFWGWKAWSSVAKHFRAPQVEQALEYRADGLLLTGHLDVLDTSYPGEVRIADFKSGRLDMDHDDQLRAYAWLGVNAFDRDRAYTAVLRVRDQTVDGRWYERDELQAWWNGLVEHLGHRDIYRPGTSQCRYCPRAHECPARQALLAAAAQVFAAGAELEALKSGNHPARASAFYNVLQRVKLLENACDQARDLVRWEVLNAGGYLSAGNGFALRVREEERKEIGYRESLPILSERVPEEQLNEVYGVGKTALEKVVRDQAGRGQKSAAVKDLLDELDRAGAITRKTIEKLEVVRDATANKAIPAAREPAGAATAAGPEEAS